MADSTAGSALMQLAVPFLVSPSEFDNQTDVQLRSARWSHVCYRVTRVTMKQFQQRAPVWRIAELGGFYPRRHLVALA